MHISQNAAVTGREEFLRNLSELQNQFDALSPEVELTVRDPDMGVEGYVVVWNTKISQGGPLAGSGKGGTRITPTLNLDEVKMLARTMALKNAAAGLPLGGAKSGLCADPRLPGFEKKYRRFVKLCAPLLRENGGPFGGFGFDIGGHPDHALWACDELKSDKCFTGKPLAMGGTDYDREGIAGYGVVAAAKAALAFDGIDPAKVTFAVQGVGAMGGAVIRYFTEAGAKLSYIADPRLGGVWKMPEEAMQPQLFEALIYQKFDVLPEMLSAYATRLVDTDTQSILYQDVDVLFPCAVQNVVTADNAGQVRARYLIEAANGPVNVNAYEILAANNCLVIPDFIANPGGIIAAYVELTSTISNEENVKTRGKTIESKKQAQERISANVREILTIARQYQVLPREAGLTLAYRRIFHGFEAGCVVA